MRLAVGPNAFEFVGSPAKRDWVMRADPYSAAMAFVRGEVDVAGDLVEAVRYQLHQAQEGFRPALMAFLRRVIPWRVLQRFQTREDAARNIRFHYDRSNEFYRVFLDERMVYTCAYYRDPGDSLAQAQLNKLDHICRKLLLKPGEKLLDIGSGWGGLIIHAAQNFGAFATGCTLSNRQAEFAADRVRNEHLSKRVTVLEKDYRDMTGTFDKISSVGMFEAVGGARLKEYFTKIHSLLKPDGLFLNHGITRPVNAQRGSEGLFIARHVFPGGEIVRLSDVITAAEYAGFEVLDVENLRRHYAITCRTWCERIRERRDACLKTVDETTWRIWQLYLAGSAVAFDEGDLNLHQVLMSKRAASSAAPMTRNYMYNR
jgi:cyclopropane-fatty-acyl-phospholipid synthase